MHIIVLFFPRPNLLPWSVAIPKVDKKLALVANSGAFSSATDMTGTPSLSVINMLCSPSILLNNS